MSPTPDGFQGEERGNRRRHTRSVLVSDGDKEAGTKARGTNCACRKDFGRHAVVEDLRDSRVSTWE